MLTTWNTNQNAASAVLSDIMENVSDSESTQRIRDDATRTVPTKLMSTTLMCLGLKCPTRVLPTQFPSFSSAFWIRLHFAKFPLRERHSCSWCNLIIQEMVNEFQCVLEGEQQQQHSRQIPSSAYSDCPKYQLEPLCVLPRFTHIGSANNSLQTHTEMHRHRPYNTQLALTKQGKNS